MQSSSLNSVIVFSAPSLPFLKHKLFLLLADPLLSLFQPPATLEPSAPFYKARSGKVRHEDVVKMRIDKNWRCNQRAIVTGLVQRFPKLVQPRDYWRAQGLCKAFRGAT